MDLKEYEALLHDVEVRLDRLRALYEQYFQGIERLEPAVPKKEVERRIQLLRKSQPRNTALRFRTQQVIQKYTTYLTYWSRVARQIEEGTFRRDVIKARQRREEARDARRAERESAAPEAWEIDIDVAEIDVDSEVHAALAALDEGAQVPPPKSPVAPPSGSAPPARPAPPTSARPARASLSPFALPRARGASHPPSETGRASSPPSATFGKPRDPLAARPDGQRRSFAPPPDPRPPAAVPPPQPKGQSRATREAGGLDIRNVYDRYVEARRRNNERVDNVRYEAIEKSIKQMLPKLEEKHRGKRIDFEVVVKDGKVGLKPVPK